ncbi:MAG: hypothetical protein ACI9IJ_000023 [Psychromonas sp.]|jgi:hypothetical protein
MFKAQGRVRDATTGPDDYLYIILNDAETFAGAL